MAINLTKGQTIDLVKKDSTLSQLTVGLSWGGSPDKEPTKPEKKGILGMLFGSGNSEGARSHHVDMDIDSAVLMLAGGVKVSTVFWGNRSEPGIYHRGDDLTGRDKKGQYDNEEINISLDGLPDHVDKLVFIANIYNAGYNDDFSKVGNAYIRVLDDKRNELVRYNLAEDYKFMRGVVVAEMYLNNGNWKFRALGKGSKASKLGNLESLAMM